MIRLHDGAHWLRFGLLGAGVAMFAFLLINSCSYLADKPGLEVIAMSCVIVSTPALILLWPVDTLNSYGYQMPHAAAFILLIAIWFSIGASIGWLIYRSKSS